MPKNTDIDKYITEATDFAQPILNHLRQLIFTADPEMEEAIKWRQPCYSQNGLVCAMAAFKQHVNFTFFEGKHLIDKHGVFGDSNNQNLSAFKLKSIDELPADNILISYIQQAIAYNQSAEKPKKTKAKKDKAELIIPRELAEALAQNTKASEHFDNFSYSKQNDYIEWISSAKRDTTRQKRLATAIEWISEGKGRNWKYENC